MGRKEAALFLVSHTDTEISRSVYKINNKKSGQYKSGRFFI